jgi:hypothetical protein
MFERYLLDAEQKAKFFRIFIIVLAITIVIGAFNYFIGGNSLFYVALLALALAYPVIHYVRSMPKLESELQHGANALLKRHERELVVFWSIFLAAVVGMYLMLPWTKDFTFQEAFVSSVSGNITNTAAPFMQILLNNLQVLGFTFVIGFIAFSGLIFILLWNASIVVYVLSELSKSTAALHGILYMSHGLLEIGGYILIGMVGSILAYRVDRRKNFNHEIDKIFIKDISLLALCAVLLIVIGAVIEVS